MPINKSQSTTRILLSDYFDEETSKLWRNADESTRAAVKAAVGEFIVEKINSHLDRGESPVEGGGYKKYLAKRPGQKRQLISKLLEDGDLRSQITFLEEQRGSGLRVGVFSDAPELERLKASGHNKGDSITGIQRQFIPFEGQSFKERAINSKISSIIRDALGGSDDS
jgi:hypothetical protein